MTQAHVKSMSLVTHDIDWDRILTQLINRGLIIIIGEVRVSYNISGSVIYISAALDSKFPISVNRLLLTIVKIMFIKSYALIFQLRLRISWYRYSTYPITAVPPRRG